MECTDDADGVFCNVLFSLYREYGELAKCDDEICPGWYDEPSVPEFVFILSAELNDGLYPEGWNVVLLGKFGNLLAPLINDEL